MIHGLGHGPQLCRLVMRDLCRDWLLVVCQVFALAAVLMPLMVLHGLRHGILDPLVHDLATIPAMREVTPLYHANRRYDPAWFASARARADVAFVVGNILAIASELPIRTEASPDHEVRAMLTTSAPGDPLASDDGVGWDLSEGHVVVSARVAQDLGVGIGGRVILDVPRKREGVDETLHLNLSVTAVVAPDRLSLTRALVFVPEALAFEIERYRNGKAVPERGWNGDVAPETPITFSRFRLYARTLEDVAGVTAWLSGLGITPDSRQEDIGPVLALNRALSTILNVLSLFAVLGFLVALAAIQWSETERKARDLALLALIGYGPGFLVAMRLTTSLVVVGLGVGLGTGAFLGVAELINDLFPHSVGVTAGAVCTLPALNFVEIALGAALVSLIAGTTAALRALSLDSALVLRR
jgi:putative ABC transport system permease protein